MAAGEILAIMLTAAVLFAGTNVDDIVVLTVLNISSRAAGRPQPWHIWAGQYAGFTVLVAVSLAAAAGLAVVPEHWLWVLGLLPLGLGLGKLVTVVRAHLSGRFASPAVVTGLTGVTAVSSGGASNFEAGAETVAVVGPAGTLWSWGPNTYGQAGDGTTTARYTPAPTSLTGVTQVGRMTVLRYLPGTR